MRVLSPNTLPEWTKCGGHTAIWAAQLSPLTLDIRSTLGDNEHGHRPPSCVGVRGEFRYKAYDIDVLHTDGDRIVAMWSFSQDQTATDLRRS